MFRQVMLLLSALSMGFLIVTFFVYFQIGAVTSSLKQSEEEYSEFYKQSVALLGYAFEIENTSLETFVLTDEELLRKSATQIDVLYQKIKQTIEVLNGKNFSSLHKLPVESAAPNSGPTKVSDLLGSLNEASILETKLSSDAVIAENIERFLLANKHERSKSELSAALRNFIRTQNPTEKSDHEMQDSLIRAVFATVSAKSVRDLKFIGNGKFNNAREHFRKSQLTPEQDAALKVLETVFQDTYAEAANLAANTSDISYTKLTGALGSFSEKVSLIQKTAKGALDSNQAALALSAEETRSITVVLSVLVLSFGCLAGGFLAKRMSVKLNTILTSVSSEASQVGLAAQSLDDYAKKLSEATISQTESLLRGSASMEEILAMIEQTSIQTSLTKTEAQSSLDKAESAGATIAQLGRAMEDLVLASTHLDSVVEAFDNMEQQTRVINQIVFETRLLSFNASIEAARAGIHGRGFSVVAEEVGKLALLSGRAASQITELLESSRARVRDSVSTTKEKIEVGSTASQKALFSFDAISEAIRKIDAFVASIDQASREQRSGVSQTTDSIRTIESTNLENNNSVKAVESQASTLAARSNTMLAGISTLNEIISGNGLSSQKRKPSKGRAKSRIISAVETSLNKFKKTS